MLDQFEFTELVPVLILQPVDGPLDLFTTSFFICEEDRQLFSWRCGVLQTTHGGRNNLIRFVVCRDDDRVHNVVRVNVVFWIALHQVEQFPVTVYVKRPRRARWHALPVER